MKQDRELTLTIDNESNSYLRQHGTDSNGVRWCTIEIANECMARIQQELDAARLDNQKLREFIEYWSHDSRLMTFESRQVFRSGAEQLLASETFTQALAAQQGNP